MIERFFAARNIYYGWVVLAVAFITMFLVMGFRFAFGVYYVAILDDTGWQRGETAAIFSVAMLVYGFTSILSGALFDWVGPRVLFPIGCAVLGAGLMLCATIETLWQFYVYYGVIVGVSYSLVGFITHMACVPRWFVARRGLASSIALSGIGVGALVIAPISEQMLVALGWRQTFFVFGVALIVILVPLNLIFHRASPQAIGLNPDGRANDEGGAPEPVTAGITLGQAARTRPFWLLLIAVFTIGLTNMTMAVHQTRLLVDIGFALTYAAAVLGLTGFFRSLGGMIWGPLSDRVGRRPSIIFLSSMGVVAIGVLLAMGREPSHLLLWIYLACWGLGYTAVSPIYASTVADLFNGRSLGKILGTLDQGFGLGAATGPFLAGWFFDRMESYDVMMWSFIVASVVMGLTLYGATTGMARRET